MLSTQNPYNLTILNCFSSCSNCNNINCVFTYSLTEFFYGKKRLISLVNEHTIEKMKKLSVWIGIWRCKVYSIVSISKLIFKRKCIVRFIPVISFYSILLIIYFNSISMPSSSLFIKFIWKYERLKPITKQRLFFC